jgi:hypothetical protein
MILEESKKLSVECVFVREALNPQTLKTVNAYFLEEVTFSIWSEKDFETWTLLKMLGHGIEKERVLKVFLKKAFPDRTVTEELDFHSKRNGISITTSSEKRLTRAKALELIRSGKVRTFDNEDLKLSQIPH